MMKKLASILTITIILTGCGSAPEEAQETQTRFGSEGMGSASNSIIVDKETGCKYLFHKNGYAGGLSPLYKENGEIDCERGE